MQPQLPIMHRAAAVEPQSWSEADNTIEVVWTAGATVRRRIYSWEEGPQEFDEELVVSANAVRLDRLNNGAPFLNTHDQYDVAGIIGVVVPGSGRIASGKGLARVRLSRASRHADVVQNIVDGIICNISCGYRTHAVEKVERESKIPLMRVTDWEPFELSAVAMGADPAAQTRGAPELYPVTVIGAGPDRPIVSRAPLRMRMHQRQSFFLAKADY